MFNSGIHSTIAGVIFGLLTRCSEDELNDPIDRWQHKVEPWSAGVVVPFFALMSAGVQLTKDALRALVTNPVPLGIIVGLIVGKSIGIFLGSFLTARLTSATLGRGVVWADIAAVGVLSGIGFTVSMLLSDLSFPSDGFYADEAKAAVAVKVKLPAGYRIVWGGQFENQQRASARLMLVIPVALLLIFFVLLATLRSLRAAILILLNIPFAMVGGVVSLWASGEYLSVPASVGFIALLGIAVLNGLVLVAYFRQLLAEGYGMAEAVRQGAERRLRPVLMTASITAFGLVPLLFASGPGSEIQRPLAIVVIGGLITSTLLTLVLLPILFERFGESAGETENA